MTLKRIFILLSLIILFTQCGPGASGSYHKASCLLEKSEKQLLTYHDEAAWIKALSVEDIARRRGYQDILCKSLLVKGKVCDYACTSEEANRDDEALGYLYESVALADANEMLRERVMARYIISEVYVNKNRWKKEDIDSLIYYQAGRWLEDGEKIAGEAKDTALLKKAITYRLRYLRQGGKNDDAISLCQSVIASCSADDNLMLQQMYDQLTTLYQLTGDNKSSIEAHSKYVLYTQKQMSQIADDPQSAGKSLLKLQIIIFCIICAILGACLYLTMRKLRLVRSRKRNNKGSKKELDLKLLTPREREILQLMADGKDSSDIARILFLSQRTVSNHKQNIYSKLGVNSGQELLRHIKESE